MNHRLPVTETSQVAFARREVAALARSQGFDETDIGRLALVVTELATNLVRHGRGGNMLIGVLDQRSGPTGVEILALDQGPGMVDVQQCLRDGFSSAGTPGTGFGAIRRQADEFDIYSQVGTGTGVLAQLWPRHGRAAPADWVTRYGAVSLPKTGEEVCGDAWAVTMHGGKMAAMVVDGLGHGTFAAEAAGEAVRLFRQRAFDMPATALKAIHAGLRSTRGAAVGIAFVDQEQSRVQFAGIGNIAGALIVDGQIRRLASLNGIAGHTASRIQEFVYPYAGEEALLILASDGLATNWALDRYPGLAARHPSLIAGILSRDFDRGGRDDATVLVTRSRR